VPGVAEREDPSVSEGEGEGTASSLSASLSRDSPDVAVACATRAPAKVTKLPHQLPAEECRNGAVRTHSDAVGCVEVVDRLDERDRESREPKEERCDLRGVREEQVGWTISFRAP
jgi:hypothetical protein